MNCRLLAVSFLAFAMCWASATAQDVAPAWSITPLRVANDVSPLKLPAVLRGHRDSVRALALSPEGRWLASASYGVREQDRLIKIWDLTVGREVLHLKGPPPRTKRGVHIDGLVFSPDGKTLFSADTEGLVQPFDLAGRRLGQPLTFPDSSLIYAPALAWSADGKTFVAASAKQVAVVDAATRKVRASIPLAEEYEAVHAAISADGTRVAVYQLHETLHMFDMVAKKKLWTADPQAWFAGLGFADRDRILRSYDFRSGELLDFDVATGKRTTKAVTRAKSHVVVFHGQLAIDCNPDLGSAIFDADTGRKLATLYDDKDPNTVAIAADGSVAAVTQEDDSIRVVDLKELQKP